MSIRFLLMVSAPLFAPYTAHAQALYSSETGLYITAAPRDQSYILGGEGTWSVGLGARLWQNTDLGVRVGRGEDAPPGNPLPVTRVGQTVVEAQVSHSLKGPSGSSGWRMLLASEFIAQDHSRPVQQLPEPVFFRGGRRVSEFGGRFEMQRFWRSGDSTGVQFFPILGGTIETRSIRQSSILHEPGHIVGRIEGGTRFTVGIMAGIPVSFPLGSSRRLVVESFVKSVPIFSIYGGGMTAGLAAHLNL